MTGSSMIVRAGSVLVMLLQTGWLHAATTTWYVTPGGSGAQDGSNWGNGFATISNAVAAASGGDEILVSNGVYTVTGQTVIAKGVTVRGLDRETTIIQRSVTGETEPRHRIFRVDHADAVLESLTVRYGHTHNSDDNRGGGIRLGAGRVSNCKVTACYSKGNDNDYGVGMYITNGVASNCWIVANLGHVYTLYGGGAYVGKGGLLTHSVVATNTGAYGGGVCVDAGTVRRCSIFKNTADNNRHGGGAYIMNGGLVEFCVITNNQANFSSIWHGGGVYMEGSASKLRNCLVTGNMTLGNGGGVYMTGGLVESCTVADNVANAIGGGIYASGGTNLNTISYFNTAVGSDPNRWLSGTAAMMWSCTTPAVTGEGNKSDDPQFTARASRDYTLLIGSPAMNGGSNQVLWMTTASDLAGSNRVQGAAVDMGAYEISTNAFACGFVGVPVAGLDPLPVRLTATVVGADNPSTLDYLWDIDNNGSWDHQGVGLSVVDDTLPGGVYNVRLVVSNSSDSSTAQILRSGYIRVSPSTVYVATNGTGQVPYANWQTAATNLSDALSLAADGATILISNGTYTVMAQTVIDKGVTIRGLGRDTTIIKRSVSGDTAPKHRIFRVNHANAVLESLTVRDGHTVNSDPGDANVGGGIRLDAGRVNDCKVTGCYSPRDYYGSGMYIAGGVASNCWLVANGGHQYFGGGGGAYVGTGGLLTHSVVASNTTGNGAGVYVDGGTVRRCSIFKNTEGQRNGAGAYIKNGGLVEFCVITNNSIDTWSGFYGGGVYMVDAASKLRNCLVTGNATAGDGGGVYMTGGLVESCTVADNVANATGGGIWASGGTNLNTISYFNSAGVSGTNHLLSGTAVMTWSCTTPAVTGEGNKSDDPRFTARASRDYTLLIGSPAMNCGSYQGWMAAASDLAGSKRVQGAIVDMGCYEAMPRGGTVIVIR